MKAIFGGSVKKPLMTKVSMRHLNEIVRERNQYSRDTIEAWQDYINLKGRMDTEVSKISKRNNFLVEELESWKQQVSIPHTCNLSVWANVNLVPQIPSLCRATYERDARPQSQNRISQAGESSPCCSYRSTEGRFRSSHNPSFRY